MLVNRDKKSPENMKNISLVRGRRAGVHRGCVERPNGAITEAYEKKTSDGSFQ